MTDDRAEDILQAVDFRAGQSFGEGHGARLPSGKRLEFWRCAGSSSADLDGAVPVAPISAVAWKRAAST
jgi:hypothetical protein